MFITALAISAACTSLFLWYSHLPDQVIKHDLKKLFKDGNLVKKVKIRNVMSKDTEQYIYPDIKRIDFYNGYAQIIFAIPNGMDPEEVTKRYWLFEQGFGSNIELKGDSKTFNLLIYNGALKAFDYDADEIKKAIQGYELPIVAGKTHRGYEVYDMVNDPHLLIAGETGAGKSVQLRSIITTIITQCKNVDLHLGDLKRSEFHLFRGIAKSVDVDVISLYKTLSHVKKEMVKRGNLLDRLEVANIMDIPVSKRPNFIMVAIDEVALLKKETAIMDIIEEISAIGRALGVFLILSMQRPDHEVLDGKLKNNLTVRMAFRHRDAINSRISLGSGHAATIQKSSKGRHYIALDETYQVQAPYLSLDKAKELLKPYKVIKGELKQNEVITDVSYEVLEEESDIMELGGLDYVER